MNIAGIDAHTRYLVLAPVSQAGELLRKPFRVPVGQPERLLAALEPYRPVEVVLETSASWPWLYDLLTPSGIGVILAHAKKLRAIAEANFKRDAIDAELLARMRLAGLIPSVYPTPARQREWAILLRHRAALVAERTGWANRVHAQLHAVGLSLPRGRLLTRAGRHWVRTEAWPAFSREQQRLVRTHLRWIVRVRPLVGGLDRHIASIAATVPETTLLQTVPGIGCNRALMICAEALPISRFATPGHLAGYAGLLPRTKQSGERPVRHGPIPRGANRWLRGALVRAVVTHVQRAPESWLSQYYAKHKARVGWPVARIATARKLARALHAMLATGTTWQTEAPRTGRAPLSTCRTDGLKSD
jgi:transposase